jgi:hypothetical protein
MIIKKFNMKSKTSKWKIDKKNHLKAHFLTKHYVENNNESIIIFPFISYYLF